MLFIIIIIIGESCPVNSNFQLDIGSFNLRFQFQFGASNEITKFPMDFVEMFNISLDLSTIYFAHFRGCLASFVCCCHSILECYNLLSGVKLSIRSFCFIL